jgi:hypothetical protein
MHYPLQITATLSTQLQKIWQYDVNAKLLDITAFGDFFIQLPNGTIVLYSLTDGQIIEVTELVEEFGLPPVNLDLGDEWYQLSAQALLKEQNEALAEDQCFAFITPLFNEETPGVYGPENIEMVTITEYHQRLRPIIGK